MQIIHVMISDLSPSNSSLLEFYNDVMTFNDSIVELVCCKLDGTPVSVSCGRGLSCAAACFSREAVLCPSHNCEDCANVDEGGEEGSGERKIGEEGLEERRGGLAWSTLFSGSMTHCTRRGCRVGGRFKYCCFHPLCRNRRKRQCSWLQYFLGKLNLSVLASKLLNCRHILPTSWSYCSRRMDLRKTANPNPRYT